MTAPTQCPDRDAIDGLVAGLLPPGRVAALERHLDDCATCRRYLDEASGLGAILPVGPGPAQRQPPSDALRRVMDGLQPPPHSPARSLDPLPFLQPSDRPGFLGRLGPYEIRREIGRGGMGVVFEGLDPALNRTVAVKVLSPLATADDAARDRFRREAQAAAALEHEYVVTVHAVDQVGGVPYMVMQYVAGESLADRLDREGRLPFADVVRLGAQVARGLAAAHAAGLVHRDIKPANILLEVGSGRAKIADFGLAKAVGGGSVTLAGTVAGTPEFMSPEQAAGDLGGQAVDARSDLFSLGVVLYAACTGDSPFRADSPLLTLDRIRRDEPEALNRIDPTLPGWFCVIVERLLKKDPADRIASAEELAELLERTQAPPTVAVRPAPAVTGASPARRVSRLWWAAAVGGVFVMAALAIWYPDRDWPGAGRLGPDYPEPATPPLAGFAVAPSQQTYRHLAEAVAAARDGDVIEVHGDGPFPTGAVRATGKRLTVRAAAGSRPVLVPEVPDQLQGGPLLDTDADLLLEGLTVRWTIEVRQGASEDNFLEHCAIVSRRGRLELARCRVETGRINFAVGTSGRESVLTNCHFLAPEGAGVFWRPEPAARVTAEGCQFETRVAVGVYTAAEAPDPAAATLLLSRNTLVSEGAVGLLLDLRRKQPLKVTARRNIFDTDHLVTLIGPLTPKKAKPARPQATTDFVRSFVGWDDDANLYRRGCDYLVSRATTKGQLRSAGIGRLAGWLDLWNLPPGLSAEGIIRYRDRAGASPVGPLRLDRVDEAVGTVPDGVGADPDQVGPR